MKKSLILPILFLGFCGITIGQQLTKKESRQILQQVWDCVKKSDSSGFIKMWSIDNEQWPFHGGSPYTVNNAKIDFENFKIYFDSALAKNMKFDEVESDTVPRDDPHGYFSKYYIRAWFKYSGSYRKGFGFYMAYINNKWLIRFSPDYSVTQTTK